MFTIQLESIKNLVYYTNYKTNAMSHFAKKVVRFTTFTIVNSVKDVKVFLLIYY